MGRTLILLAAMPGLLGACRAARDPGGAQRTSPPVAPGPHGPPAVQRCAVEPTRDSVVVSVVAGIGSAGDSVSLPVDYTRALIAGIGRRLVLPPALEVHTYEPARLTVPQARETGFLSLSAVVELRLRPRAPPDRVAFLTSSLSPAFDAALQSAIDRLVRDGLGALPDGITAPRTAQLTIDTRLYPDSLAAVLFELRTPLVHFDSLVTWEPGNPRPTHPAHLRKRMEEGGVRLRFVVDADGRMVPASLRILDSDDVAFADAVAATLLFTRFRPARVDECPVASILELWYQFSIR